MKKGFNDKVIAYSAMACFWPEISYILRNRDNEIYLDELIRFTSERYIKSEKVYLKKRDVEKYYSNKLTRSIIEEKKMNLEDVILNKITFLAEGGLVDLNFNESEINKFELSSFAKSLTQKELLEQILILSNDFHYESGIDGICVLNNFLSNSHPYPST